MDFFLELCDHYFLDAVWAKLVPISAFLSDSSINALNGTTPLKLSMTSSLGSQWSHFISSARLPHPQITAETVGRTLLEGSEVSAWPRDYIPRQLVSLTVLTYIGIHILYFLFASLSYYLIFNHDMMRHPRFLKNQVRLEIESSLRAFPGMIALTLPWFQAEVMGYSMLYNDVGKYGWGYMLFSTVW